MVNSNLIALNEWIDAAKRLDNRHLNSFINGLERDKDAIQNSLIIPELPNGLAEGKVNRSKKIKRMIFDRCNFNTLKSGKSH